MVLDQENALLKILRKEITTGITLILVLLKEDKWKMRAISELENHQQELILVIQLLTSQFQI